MIHLKMKNIMKSRKTTDSTRRKGRDAQADPDEDYLDQDYDDYDNEEEERIRRIKNKVLVRVSYLMVALFLSMAGYLIYFNVVLRDDINNNQYNTKQSAYQEQIIRGNIYSADGNVLAQTDIAEDGTESRSYPYSNLFAHIVGYATNGKSGIESVHNYDLLSSHASILDQIREEKLDTKVQGDSLVLTLNTQLQQVCYDALGDNKGAIVVLEPSTGKVLAMVSKPDFDPNTIEQDWDAQEGRHVLAADVDPDANLGLALGFSEEELDSIVPITRMRKLIQERTGANDQNQFYKLNPKVDDIPDTYSKTCNGVKLLVLGTVETAGSGCVCPEHVMLKRIINHLVLRSNDVVILDMEAGLEHLGRGTTEGMDQFIVVIEPGARSIQTYKNVKRLAAELGVRQVRVVANKVRNEDDEAFIRSKIPQEDLLGFIHYNSEIIDADRQGKSPFDVSPNARAEISIIKSRIDADLSKGGK